MRVRRFKQQLAGRPAAAEIPLKRWLGVASHRCPAGPKRRRHDVMTCPSTQLRLAPITTGLVRRNPRILLSGPHQPTLVRYLEGWPKRWNGSRTFLIQFAQDGKDLARFPSDAFDFAVVQAPEAEDLDLVVRQLIRVGRRCDSGPARRLRLPGSPRRRSTPGSDPPAARRPLSGSPGACAGSARDCRSRAASSCRRCIRRFPSDRRGRRLR